MSALHIQYESAHVLWCALKARRLTHIIAGHLRTASYNDSPHYRPPPVLSKLRWSTNCGFTGHSNGQ